MHASTRPSPKAILRAANVPAFLVSDLTNIRYLTGLQASAGSLLVSASGYELFLDGRYLEAAKSAVRRGIKLRPAAAFVDRLKTVRRIGIESESVTLQRFGIWQKKFKNTKFVQTAGVVAAFRRAKQVDERKNIRVACVMTKKVLAKIPSWLKSGITERELAWKIDTACRTLGADGMAFETIVGFGESTARPHHHPTDRKLGKKDIVQIDMGAAFRGYASDYSRVFFIAKPTAEQAKALKAVQAAKRSAERLIRIGASTRSLDRAARETLRTFGFDKEFCHALGHGLGLDIHEGVTISEKAPDLKILKNEVITVEPGLYFDGRFGIRLEDTIIVS